MFNYMKCSQMLFGKARKYSITFKTNQPNFSVYRKKSEHDFKVNLVNRNLEGAVAIQLDSIGLFVVAHESDVKCYDDETFMCVEQEVDIPIKLLTTDTREST